MHRPWCQRDHGIDDDLSTKICIQLCAIVFDSSVTRLSWWTVTQRLLVLTMICVIDSTLMNSLLRLVFSIWSYKACLCFVFPIFKICKYFSSIVNSYDIVGIDSSDGGKTFLLAARQTFYFHNYIRQLKLSLIYVSLLLMQMVSDVHSKVPCCVDVLWCCPFLDRYGYIHTGESDRNHTVYGRTAA